MGTQGWLLKGSLLTIRRSQGGGYRQPWMIYTMPSFIRPASLIMF